MLFKKNKLNRQEAIVKVDTPEYQSYVDIKINLDFTSIDKKVKVYGFTSTMPGEGKSSTACNLAQVLANEEKKVVILDLDLRRPTTNYFFKLPNDVGVSDYLAKELTLDDVIKHTFIDNVDLITAGTHTPYPQKILVSEGLKKLVLKLKEMYDYVLIDTPPILASSDMINISSLVDEFVMVCYYGVTKKTDFDEAIKRLKNTNSDIAGIVFTKVPKKKATNSYSSYSYSYVKNKNGI